MDVITSGRYGEITSGGKGGERKLKLKWQNKLNYHNQGGIVKKQWVRRWYCKRRVVIL